MVLMYLGFTYWNTLEQPPDQRGSDNPVVVVVVVVVVVFAHVYAFLLLSIHVNKSSLLLLLSSMKFS